MGVLSKVEMNLDIRDISIESLRCEWARFVHKPFFFLKFQDGVFFFFFGFSFVIKTFFCTRGTSVFPLAVPGGPSVEM